MVPSLKHFLAQVLDILQAPDERRESMLAELEHLIQFSAATHLISTLPEGDRQKLNGELARQPQENHTAHIAVFITPRFKRDQYLGAVNQAAHEVIPEYVAALARGASSEQKSRIQRLLEERLLR